MPTSLRSLLLSDLSWVEIREHLGSDTRLIVPVGSCDQFGPHLPVGAATLVVEAVAHALSRDFGVLRAPTLPYGVNLPAERRYAGVASLHEKTLHRVINDLLASWEDHGFREFILLTAHRYEPHVEAIAAVSATGARVRVIELLGIEAGEVLEADGLEHGGEMLTSLMLYLHPEKVNLSHAEDYPLAAPGKRTPYRLTRLPATSPGNLGHPTLATAEKGERIFEHLVQRIRTKVFLEQDLEG